MVAALGVSRLCCVGGPVVLADACCASSSPSTRPAFGINGARSAAPRIFGMMIWLLYIRFIVPVLGVFYGTALIADEVDDKTITYLFTRPIPRGAVLVGKYLAYLVCTVLLVLPSVVLVYFLIVPIGGGSIGGVVSVAAARTRDAGDRPGRLRCRLRLGRRAPQAAARGRAGVRVRLGAGVLLFPGYLKRLTVAYYSGAGARTRCRRIRAVSLLMQVFREVRGLLPAWYLWPSSLGHYPVARRAGGRAARNTCLNNNWDVVNVGPYRS